MGRLAFRGLATAHDWVVVRSLRVRRTNVPEADARGFFRQIGEGESRGLELEAVGSVTR